MCQDADDPGAPDADIILGRELPVTVAIPSSGLDSRDGAGGSRNESSTLVDLVAAGRLADSMAVTMRAGDLARLARELLSLRDSESQYRSIFNNAQEGIYQSTPDGHYIRVNMALARMYGYDSPEELISGLTNIATMGYVDPADRTRFQTLMDSADIVRNFEAQFYRRDGSIIWITENARCVRDKDGKLLYYEGIVENITARKDSEIALRASKARYDELAARLPVGISTLRMRADGSAAFDYASPKYYDILGLDPAALQRDARAYFEAVHPDDLKSLIQANEDALRDGKPFKWEGRFLVRGEIRWISLESIPNMLPDGDSLWSGVTSDITDRKRAEVALAQSQRREAIGQLTAGVAHEFNNLLAVILGNLEFIKDGIGDPSDLAEEIDQALGAVERGAELVQLLMSYAQKGAVRSVESNLNQLISSSAKLLASSLGATIEIVPQFGQDIWGVFVDPVGFQDTLINLGVNARDAMPKGGRLMISTENVTIDEAYAEQTVDARAGQYVKVSVIDEGVGMTPDIVAKAFDPFFTTKEVGQGTGLGLSMVYGFVKQAGGFTNIYSEPGVGTRVSLYLPRSVKEEIVPVVQSPAAAPPAKPLAQKILLVDDNPSLRASMGKLLRSMGYETLEAATVSDGMATLRANQDVNLVLTDVIMPGGETGADMARQALALCPSVKIVFISGYSKDLLIHEGRVDPSVVLLQKPFTKDQLTKLLRSVLDDHPDAK
jgi:PAS domain S-box-containing protein